MVREKSIAMRAARTAMMAETIKIAMRIVIKNGGTVLSAADRGITISTPTTLVPLWPPSKIGCTTKGRGEAPGLLVPISSTMVTPLRALVTALMILVKSPLRTDGSVIARRSVAKLAPRRTVPKCG